jgi:hypothetical protein
MWTVAMWMILATIGILFVRGGTRKQIREVDE